MNEILGGYQEKKGARTAIGELTDVDELYIMKFIYLAYGSENLK
jgi:hypothetical protein